MVFGEQEGREVTIFESFEIAFTVDKASGKIKPEIEALETDMKLCNSFSFPIHFNWYYSACLLWSVTEVYPNYECLGWYTTGKDIREGDMELHKKVKRHFVFAFFEPIFYVKKFDCATCLSLPFRLQNTTSDLYL